MTQIGKPPTGKNGTPQAKDKDRDKRPERERAAAAVARNGEAAVAAEPAFDAWARASHVALIGLFVIAVLWCAYVARPVIVPVVLAWVIATIVLPVIKRMQDYGVPRVASAIAVTRLRAPGPLVPMQTPIRPVVRA